MIKSLDPSWTRTCKKVDSLIDPLKEAKKMAGIINYK